jgi:uncharacterized protein DUF1116
VRLVGVRPAREATETIGPRRYLHAGPPLALEELTGPMRAAVAGALLYEGEVRTLGEADEAIRAGRVALTPCHHAGGVGAMAGIVTPRMPVVVVETSTGRRAFAPLNEGLGRALGYGMNDPPTLERLAWLTEEVAPLLDAAIAETEPIDVTALQTEGLRRGDECHNRNVASSAALVLRLAPALVRAARASDVAARVLGDLGGNPQLFLSFSMATAKAIMDEVQATGGGRIVTAIASNGRQTGIRVSGGGDRWFLAEAPVGTPKLRPGFSLADVSPSMGDSPIIETSGLGAFAFSAAPALAETVGGDPTGAIATVAEMRQICLGTSSRYLVPVEGYRGTPIGIDVAAVAATGIAPLFSDGLSHRTPGIGVIGAALTRVPLAPFVEAAAAIGA